MRLFTAITVALTVLLVTSTVGAVAATPSATAAGPQPAPDVADRPVLETSTDRALAQLSTTAQLSSSTANFQSDTVGSPPGDAGPEQVIRISFDEDGNAHWAIEHRFVLTDDDEVDNFRAYADAVEAGERDLGIDRQWFDYRASEAATRTDREMSIRNAGWDEPRVHSLAEDDELDAEAIEGGDEGDESDETDIRVGVITYSLTWTNFASAENDRLHIGDTFQTDRGYWLTLTETQRLNIESPDGYALETPTTLMWDGPYVFEEGELDIIFVRSGGTLLSGWQIGGIVLLVIGVGVASYLLARRDPERDAPGPLEDFPERVAGLGLADVLTRVRSRVSGRSESDRKPATAADTDGGTVEPRTGAAVDPASPSDETHLEFEEDLSEGIDPELLSDEERVLRMLKQNGGRMKQASIVTETGWSNAKVSQLLSQMDDDDEIEKLRIGRENLITLPEVDPTEL